MKIGISWESEEGKKEVGEKRDTLAKRGWRKDRKVQADRDSVINE